jgi:hypothetical protein
MNKNQLNKFRRELQEVSPIHDTPFGKLHPYWARKPLNIIETIIKNFSSENDLILDPFMGSGTSLFAAAKLKRRAIGTDINPLSTFIVESTFALVEHSNDISSKLEKFVLQAEDFLLPLFKIDEVTYLERSRYRVTGDFENGNFDLLLEEVITKEYINNKWTKRRALLDHKESRIPKRYSKYLNYPVDFRKCKLIANSRIAIPKGANLSHYFSKRNIICINFLLTILIESPLPSEEKNILRFLLSSALPLMRLSDKKASTQWPYWRPKNNLTSRNPLIILRDRLDKFNKAIEWSKSQKFIARVQKLNSDTPVDNAQISIGQLPIQKLSKIITEKPKLIVTDPPYTDHVPYLEYSALWNEILDFGVTKSHFKFEIVNSDAPDRAKDSKLYRTRLAESLKSCCDIVEEDGIIIWFYQDQEFKNWEQLYKTSIEEGLRIVDIVPLKKQRRSMKSVTSPGKTLDGDLILVFHKSPKTLDNQIPKTKLSTLKKTYYEKYASIVKNALLNGDIVDLTKKHSMIHELIDK